MFMYGNLNFASTNNVIYTGLSVLKIELKMTFLSTIYSLA